MIESITSELFEATNRMQPLNYSQKITVYTESFEDIGFWRTVLDDFEVPPYQFDIYSASRETNNKGKLEALNREIDILSEGVGKQMIICIDSDYDYLLQSSTEVSKKINESPYIFQTYVYSIENYMCHAETLHTVCTIVTKTDTKDVDFVSVLQEYSNIIYKPLLLSIWLAKRMDTEVFNFSKFTECISFPGKLDINKKNIWFKNLKERVDKKCEEIYLIILEKYFSGDKKSLDEDLIDLEKEINILGLNIHNSYLFLKGHILKETFIHHLLRPICEKRKQEMIDDIVAKGGDIEGNINLFKGKCRKLEEVLEENTGFKMKCMFYNKLKYDLQNYVDSLLAKN